MICYLSKCWKKRKMNKIIEYNFNPFYTHSLANKTMYACLLPFTAMKVLLFVPVWYIIILTRQYLYVLFGLGWHVEMSQVTVTRLTQNKNNNFLFIGNGCWYPTTSYEYLIVKMEKNENGDVFDGVKSDQGHKMWLMVRLWI